MEMVTYDKLINVVNGVMEDDDITIEQINDDLPSLGMDSISFIQIIVGLEEAFDCEIPDSKLLISEMNTVQKMLDVLQELYRMKLA